MDQDHTASFSDAALVKMVRQGGADRQNAIKHIYEWSNLKKKITAMIKVKGGSEQDATDLFHEGIIAMDRNIRLDKYRSESSLQGYLYSICRFIWYNQWRKMNKVQLQDVSASDGEMITPEINLFEKEKKEHLRKVLDLLDDNCRKIISLWKQSYSMQEIAAEINLSSPQLAKKYKYRCFKKLMKALDQHPTLLKLLEHG